MAWPQKSITPFSEEDLLTLEPLDQEELLPVPQEQRVFEREEQQEMWQGPFVTEDGVKELILYISLCLRAPTEMPILEGESWGSIMYKRNQIQRALEPLIPNLLRMCNFITSSNYVTDTLLPDVCGACFTSFGLCISGRVRPHCHLCMYKAEGVKGIIDFWNRMRILQMLGNNQFLMDHIESQLIYKYYSPNGDKSWKIILPVLGETK